MRRRPLDERTEEDREVVREQQLDRLATAATRWTGNDARILATTEAEVADGGEPALAGLAQEGVTVVGDRGFLLHPRRSGLVSR